MFQTAYRRDEAHLRSLAARCVRALRELRKHGLDREIGVQQHHVQIDDQRPPGRDARMAFRTGITRFDRISREELHISPLPGAQANPAAIFPKIG